MNKRQRYVVVKDFEDYLPFGNCNVKYKYAMGDIVQLKVEGGTAIKWLNKCLIEIYNPINQ